MTSEYRGPAGGGMSFLSIPTLSVPTDSGRSIAGALALRNILREGRKRGPSKELRSGVNATLIPATNAFAAMLPTLSVARTPSAPLSRLNVALHQACMERN